MSPVPRLGMRLHRFLFESEQQFPQATGELSVLLSQLGLAGMRISRLLSAAGLIDVLGVSGAVNVQGEQQQKLDALANEIFLDAFAWGQLVPTLVYTAAGNPGVHVFTLDPGIGEFLLSAPDVRIPDHGPYYGANEGGSRSGTRVHGGSSSGRSSATPRRGARTRRATPEPSSPTFTGSS